MGLEYWQSLEQLSNSPETIERLEREFPGYDPDQIQSVSRRRFMKLMSASMALAGLTLSGCRRWPQEQLAPYSVNPRQRIPGIPEQYATVYEIGGVGHGLLVTSYDGRPIKVEGNPSHPFARTFDGKLGAADAFAQASVLELYDPQRSRWVIDRTGQNPVSSSWTDFARAIAPLRNNNGQGFAILSERTSSPSALAMRQRLQQVFPQAKWYEYEPLWNNNEQTGLGGNFRTQLHLDRADVIVSLDADILGTHPAHVRYSADWAKRRRSPDTGETMNRMYVAESRLSLTGAAADNRIGLRVSRIPLIAAAMASGNVNGLEPNEAKFVQSAMADVRRNGVVVAGAHLPSQVHAAVHAINTTIGAYGKTITLLQDPTPAAEPIGRLAEQIKSNGVNTLLVIGGNPAYDAPANLEFDKLLSSVANSIHLSLYDNETSVRCKWHLPRAHYLESWGDARAWDGTVSIQQPLILPLFDGRSTIELLAMICNEQVTDGRAIVQRTFATVTGNNAESAFRRILHDGILPDSQFAAGTATAQAAGQSPATAGSGFEIRFLADQKVLDGRFATNGWLQELPDSLTKLTWDNAALLSKKDADQLGITTGDVIRIGIGQRSLEIAAYVLPGQPIGVIGLPLGYGRTTAGNIGTDVGFNCYALRTSDAMDFAAGATVTKVGKTYPLAQTQEHHIIDSVGFKGRQERVGEKGHSGRVIRDLPLAEFQKESSVNGHHTVSLPILMQPHGFNSPHAWGMAIDMNSCIGCSGCVVACQAENNIPIVGKEQVINGREMHWLRIDRYFKGEMDDPNPDLVYQPMMCVHCENAPCEQVCPVAATVHDSEGLNTMVYNRCIGTRYCSNNCPYKVRRFNYFDWHSKAETNLNGAGKPWLGMPDTQQREAIDRIRRMVFNPEVTVRMRGVMEKCTFCVQRIHTTQTAKRNAGEEIKDGDIVTACQQACPTEAIVFGNLNDPNSRVSKLHANKRTYSVLEDLNTKPRARHMAKLRNPSA